MPQAEANGIRIEYEIFGDPADPPLLLVMGLGAQLIHWPEEFCRALAARGLRVIRFDNRDAGLSGKCDDRGTPNLAEILPALMRGVAVRTPYTIADMADDAAGLLTTLGIEKAHVCGASMGGMIAQILAVRHPARVLSLVSIYSTTGNPALPRPRPEVLQALMTPAPAERAACIAHTVALMRQFAGSGLPFDEPHHRRLAARAYDRAFYPQGTLRQMAAIMVQGNRRPALAAVAAPTLVVHGDEDPLVPLEAGRDTAAAIPGAELMVIAGMGHELPAMNAHWLQILDAIAGHTAEAGR